MQSFAEYAFRAIKKHPEIFSALEEFERTKKLPRFTHRKRIDITVDERILELFKKHCREKSINLSRAIEEAMKQSLKKNLTKFP